MSIRRFLICNHSIHLHHSIPKAVSVSFSQLLKSAVGCYDRRKVVFVTEHKKLYKRITDFAEIVIGRRFHSKVIKQKNGLI